MFETDYSKFPRTESAYRKNWTICTFGERIKTFRNPEKNNEWDNKTVRLTDEFKKLFEQYGIDYKANDLKSLILERNEASFYKTFIYYLSLTLQMRNSEIKSDVDYLISPVLNSNAEFYNSEKRNEKLPHNADANGAYHIASKALWAIKQIKKAKDEDLPKVKISISSKEWLEFVQKRKL